MPSDLLRFVIDQNTANSGWNEYHGTRRNQISNATLAPSYVALYPSGNSSYNTGADGIYVKYVC